MIETKSDAGGVFHLSRLLLGSKPARLAAIAVLAIAFNSKPPETNASSTNDLLDSRAYSVGVFLVNPSNIPEIRPFNIEDVRNVYNGPWADHLGNTSVREYFQKAANLTLNFTFFDWTTTGALSCQTLLNESDLRELGRKQGTNLNNFQRLVLITPTLPNCTWGGWGENQQAIINGTLNPKAQDHELLHTFGIDHAGSLTCNSEGSCTIAEYGGTFDPMGSGTIGSISTIGVLNARHKDAIGALPANAIKEVTTSGNYTLVPIHQTAPAETQVLKIPKPMSTPSSSPYYYYVEFRSPDEKGPGSGMMINYTHASGDNFTIQVTPPLPNNSSLARYSSGLFDQLHPEYTDQNLSIRFNGQDTNHAYITVTLP